MRIPMSFLLSFATACAANNAARAPATMAVDPQVAITLNEKGNYEITPEGVIALKQAEIEVDTRHAIELALCDGDKELLTVQRDSAVKRLEHNEWWSRFGPALIVSGFIAGVAGGIGAAFAVQGAR